MSIRKSLEDYGVAMTFAEADAWRACPINQEKRKENNRMTKALSQKKSRARNRAMLFGIVSIALYAAVFTNASTIMTYFTKGHFFALLPVATVFVFSYVHGSFASNLWTALGIEASKKATSRKEVAEEKRPQKQPRPRAYAN